MNRLVLILLLASCLIGCKKSSFTGPLVDQPSVAKPAKIELTFERAVIKANGIEQTTLSTRVTDANGNVMNEICTITMNGIPYSNAAFKTSAQGDYTFQASIGTLLSNSFIVKATEN